MAKELKYMSVLSVQIEKYIAEKRAVGYKFDKGAELLKKFDSFLFNQTLSTVELTKQVVLEWTAHKSHEKLSTQCGRISLLRGLAEYMNRVGYSAYVCPKAMVTVDRYAYSPYIFTNAELQKIFDLCDHYPPCSSSPNRHLVLPLIIRILYGCGLRISEAVHLRIEDVDLEQGVLYIRNTKFNKERIIPMAESLKRRCQEYYITANIGKKENYYFFPSPIGGHYTESTIYKLFRGILRKAGISHLGRGKGPRIHDIRHVFAINCLKKWVLEGKDLNNCLPYLSVYLGHEDLRGSQRYLRLTADLYPDITSKIEKSCSYIIPEVELNETD